MSADLFSETPNEVRSEGEIEREEDLFFEVPTRRRRRGMEENSPPEGKVSMGIFIQQNVSPIVTGISGLFGMNRGDVCNRLRNLSLSLDQTQERQLIEILVHNGIIKHKFHDQIGSLEELQNFQLSMRLTHQRLDRAVTQWQELTGENLAFEIDRSGAAFSFISNPMWKVRDAWFRVMHHRKDFYSSAARSSMAIKLLYHISTSYAGNFGESVETGWYKDDVSGMPKEARIALEEFLSRKDKLFSDISKDFMAIVFSAKENGFKVDSRRVSHEERLLYRNIASVLSDISQGQNVDGDRIRGLLDSFERLPNLRLPSALVLRSKCRGILNSFRTVIDNTEKVRKANRDLEKEINEENKEALRKAEAELLDSVRESILRVSDIVTKNRFGNRVGAGALMAISLLAICVSVSYIAYRSYMFLSTDYLTVPIRFAGLLLLSAEIFYNTLAIIFQSGVFHSAKKSTGDSWLPALRQGLDSDPDKRSLYAWVLTMVDEPPSAINPNIISHIRSAWEYGKNGHTIIGDMSSAISNKKGAQGTQNYGIKMTVRKLMMQEMVMNTLRSEERIENETQEEFENRTRILADRLSNVMASEQTEIDDADCMYYAVARMAEVARRYNMKPRHIKALGRIMAGSFEVVNAGRENSYLVSTIDKAWLTRFLIQKGVSPLKVNTLTNLIMEELISATRRSVIARAFDHILKGEDLGDETNNRLRTAMQEEFGLSEVQAIKIITGVERNQKHINDAAAEVVGEYDFSPSQGSMDQRKVFFALHGVMARLMWYDKRFALITEDLFKKIRQMVEYELYIKKGTGVRGFLARNIPVVGSIIRWRYSRKVARRIARDIDNLPNISELIENLILEKNLTFELAVERAQEIRREQIREVMSRIGKDFIRLNENNIEDITRAITANLEEGYRLRSLCATEFANQVVQDVKGQIDANPLVTPEEILKYIIQGHLSPANPLSSFSRVVDTIIKDLFPGAKLSPPVLKDIKEILGESENPVAERDALVEQLATNLRFPTVAAQSLVDAYIAFYSQVAGTILEVIPLIETMLRDGRLKTRKADDSEISRNGEVIILDSTPIDLEQMKKESKERVQMVDIAYRGGMKAGVINCAILGDTIPRYIGEVSRWVINRMVSEQIFGQRHCPQEIIRLIDREISGKKEMIPLIVNPRLCDAEYIGSYLITALAEGKSAAEASLELIAQWGLADSGNHQLFNKLIEVATKIHLRLALSQVVDALGADQDCDISDVVADIARENNSDGEQDEDREKTIFNGRQQSVLRDYGRIIQRALRRGHFVIEGPSGQRRLRLSESAERDRRVEDILFEHYVETVDGYYARFIFGMAKDGTVAQSQFDDFSNSVEEIWEALKEAGYINEEGIVQPNFDGNRRSFNLSLDLEEREKNQIFNILQQSRGITDEEMPRDLIDSVDEKVTARVFNGSDERTPENFIRRVMSETQNGRSLEDITSGIVSDWRVRDRDAEEANVIENNIKEMAGEVRNRMWLGAFVSNAVEASRSDRTIVNHSFKKGTENNAPVVNTLIENNINRAAAYSDKEKEILKTRAQEIIGILSEIYLKESIDALLVGHSAEGRLELAPGDSVSLRAHVRATDQLEEIQGMIIYNEPATAEQIAENIISVTRLPNMTMRREAFALEVRKLAPHIAQAFAKVKDEISASAQAMNSSRRTDDAIRELTFEAIEKIKPLLDEVATRDPSIKNYLNETMPIASTLKYSGFQCDDADYRAHPTAMLEQAPYLQERKSVFMTGQRQFGRERGKSAVADAFQSGGHAYWGHTNIRGSIIGLVPSWGSCIAYSGRAYRESAFWVSDLPYEGTFARTFTKEQMYQGKFTPSKGYNYLREEFVSKPFYNFLYNRHPWWRLAALPLIVPARVLDLAVRLPLWVADKYFTGSFLGPLGLIAPLATVPIGLILMATGSPILGLIIGGFAAFQVRDLFHEIGKRGILTRYLAKPINREEIINKPAPPTNKLHEIFAIQDTTTESEDIASCIHFLRSMKDMSDMATSWAYLPVLRDIPGLGRARRALSNFSFNSQFKPMSLWDGMFMEGIGTLGAHSDSLRGANSTYFSRWARGNMPIIWPILRSRMGAYRKMHFASLSLFWNTGFFRPILMIMPPAFMFMGLTSILMGATETSRMFFLIMVGASFSINVSAFLASMYSRGYLRESAGCIFLDFAGLSRMLKSFDEGTMRGERPPFEPSPKESNAPERLPLSKLSLEYALMLVNTAGVLYTMDYGRDLVQKILENFGLNFKRMDGTLEITAAGIWCAINLIAQVYALGKFNRGVFTQTPYLGVLKSFIDRVAQLPNNLYPLRGNTDPLLHLNEEGGKKEGDN